ncbi:MAG TPA: hypothetical protein VM328_03455, partial [Fimbriimonadaceae bacterium]|nr:hypothetical protein [Fimbriimonadaceae bacterium]
MENDINQSALWTKLASFQIDSGDESLTFEKRLARENGWTVDFARRVIEEYKRFVFLCMKAGHPCTPSDQVDQAWHLHLTYTVSYWEGLCAILPRPLHHNPTKGGLPEDDKFDDWYARTRESYARLFGEAPPPDIWPSAEERFGIDPYAQRVNLKRYWVIPKEPAKRALLLSGVLVGIAGCSTARGGADPLLAAILFMIAAAVLIILAVIASRRRDGSGGAGGGGCGGFFGSGCGGSDGGSGCGGGGCGG